MRRRKIVNSEKKQYDYYVHLIDDYVDVMLFAKQGEKELHS